MHHLVKTRKQICLQKNYFLLISFYKNGYVLLCTSIYISEDCDNFLQMSVKLYTYLNNYMISLIQLNDILTQMRNAKGYRKI